MEITMTKEQKNHTTHLVGKFVLLAETRGNNAKKDALENMRDDEGWTNLLHWFLDDQIVTGISEKKLAKDCRKDADNEIYSIEALIDYLSNNNTGRSSDVGAVQLFADNFAGTDIETMIYKIVSKRIPELGLGVTMANEVYGDDFIDEFKVILADKYFDDPDYWDDKTFGIQCKLDGFRTVFFKRGDKVWAKSRGGKDLTGQFPEIENDVRSLPMDTVVLDGERMPVGFKDMTSGETFKAASNSSKKGEKTGYCLAVYDAMTLEEWESKSCSDTYEKRYSNYRHLLTSRGDQRYDFLYGLELEYVGTDCKEIVKHLEIAKANKKEGVMVKDMNALYVWDRTQAIVKVKSFFDIDVVIEGFEYGTGKNKTRAGSLFFTYKGNKVSVGSGLNDEQRIDIAANFEKNWKGKVAEILFFEETSNKNGTVSLRFPRFKTLKSGD